MTKENNSQKMIQVHMKTKAIKSSFVCFQDNQAGYCIYIFGCYCLFVFVCFVALHPKSTAMVIAGQSVHLTTLFPGQA